LLLEVDLGNEESHLLANSCRGFARRRPGYGNRFWGSNGGPWVSCRVAGDGDLGVGGCS
jgi:hypothetical protein